MTNGADRGAGPRSGNRFVMSVVTGVVLGSGFGLPFSPHAYSALWWQITGSATRAGNTVAHAYRRTRDAVTKALMM